jgi:hypothetical protein
MPYRDRYADAYSFYSDEEAALMAITLGIDVSWWQGQIDWSQVATTPYRFGICRMTRAGRGVDETGRRNLRGILGHLPVAGGYGVVGTVDPVGDAKALMDELAAVTDPHQVLVMLDAERFADGTGPSRRHINAFAVQVHAELGRWPIAYVPDWYLDWLATKGDGDGTVGGLELASCPWAPSEYIGPPWTETRISSKKPTNLRGFKGLAWHQFTSSGTVAGVATRVDLNAYYGTLAELRTQLLGRPEEGLFMALTDQEEQEVLRAARQINGAVGAGQVSFEKTIEATLGTAQTLVNLVKQAQGSLAGSIVDLRSALLGAIAAQPGLSAEQAQAIADQVLAGISEQGVDLNPDALLEALRLHPLAPVA